MLAWLKRLFGLVGAPKARPGAPRPASAGPRAAAEEALRIDLDGLTQFGNLDDERHLRGGLRDREQKLLDGVIDRVQAGSFELPQLPATSLAAMDMAANPGVEVTEVVELISTDPALSSELLRMANSALYASREPSETLHQAVMRVGLRNVRSMILTISMRGTILRMQSLSSFAEEVWRQAYSVGRIARAIAPCLGVEPEKAFLIGLLHDIGKVALLSALNQEASQASEVSPAMVGRLFYEYHQTAGDRMGEKWKLSEELRSVAANHHSFKENEAFGRSAALAALAHRLDLFLSIAREDEYRGLVRCEHLEYLGVEQGQRFKALELARDAYRSCSEEGVVGESRAA